ncbi:sugar-transporting ATPase, partial [Dickeya dadantii]|nr:sugar-transporting ATPase [Dickeya dadantii]
METVSNFIHGEAAPSHSARVAPVYNP